MIKLLVPETGSDEAHTAYTEASSILCVSIGYVEATSALARMRKGERITSGQLREKREVLEQLWRSASVHATSHALIDSAAQVSREDALRAYDAVHLAAALSFAQSEQLEFACWDIELRKAAAKRGLSLVPTSL